ncbi:MAG TPA: FIST C-terminal domain-containing protein [Rhodocyclaceae bacterium]|nr:FIST C-terminal domain-containing protein [Betaproteobacteria bacterium]HMV00141.1 FIST C-terminal domain-containing protein [Rhodocyclaceae bacterium]HMV19869.1 FIST C-terminal domain-containing protein [Rhodocyclaceae bacterium]HNE42128.1 FIST C-terminal domain-containing protein [Rhodocyclaceae bacterium]HNM23349.1 FIST C-terminal domain-containing protein [Rhodocyclaceae bacterium]
MKAASALASAPRVSAALAAEAVHRALASANLTRAEGVVLFLSAAFARHAQAAVTAASGVAGTLQVAGMVTEGVLTETGWCLDQPAAAALVLGEGSGLMAPDAGSERITLTGAAALPEHPGDHVRRWGIANAGHPAWQCGRLASPMAEFGVAGCRMRGAISPGLQFLNTEQAVTETRGYDLLKLGNLPAAESLRRALPAALRDRLQLPIHWVAASVAGIPIPILSANGDGSLSLGCPLAEGSSLRWALRQPLAAEADMAASLEPLAAACQNPACALMFSCIGRGPLFYEGDDRDLLAFRRRFPGVPLVGAYGSGQIAPWNGATALFRNSVATLLFEPDHVQSLP